MDRWYELNLENKTSDTIVGWYSNLASTSIDTLLPDANPSEFFEYFYPNAKEIIIYADFPFETWFLTDTSKISIYIFSKDTIDICSWNEIRASYKILQRYDLGHEDIKKLEYCIPYPPTIEMKGMKMYPPFKEK